MNKNRESGEEPCRAFVNSYWLILRWKEGSKERRGPQRCHGDPLFTDHLLTLSKDLTPLLGRERSWWSSKTLWFPYQSRSISHVTGPVMVDSWINMWSNSNSVITAVRQDWWAETLTNFKNKVGGSLVCRGQPLGTDSGTAWDSLLWFLMLM